MSLISLQNIGKIFGNKTLFQSLNLSIEDKQKIAVIGKNGTGKSTLMKIMAGIEDYNSGDITKKKGLQVEYVAQDSVFPENKSIFEIIFEHLESKGVSDEDIYIDVGSSISIGGFEDQDIEARSLSGGWQKKLAIAKALASKPDLLLLDEPTNHLDWDGIQWLINSLHQYKGSYVVISHDRYLLNQSTRETIEIGPVFKNENLRYPVAYDDFVEKRLLYYQNLEKQVASMSNKARRELDWLRAGVKARTTKSRSRQKEANELIENVSETKTLLRNSQKSMKIDLQTSSKKTKRLVKLKEISFGYDNHNIIEEFSYELHKKKRIGILGDNGTGKSTIANLITGSLKPSKGSIELSPDLKILYFDQKKASLPLNETFRSYLGDGTDYVTFQDKSVHVASYASRFLLSEDLYNLKIEKLSGGEKAKLALAKLLLNPVDVLILDEPTNDLDISAIEQLENVLQDMSIACILISHDRNFLKNLCHDFVCHMGSTHWKVLPDFDQWESEKKKAIKQERKESNSSQQKLKKLSYKNQLEYDSIDDEIQSLELRLEEQTTKLQDPEIVVNSKKLTDLTHEIKEIQAKIDLKFERWNELESLKK
ncbi:MAG: ABC-F family ATP-binding cassette domain-containing protein [Bdellovibrionales bacterium]